LRAAAFFVASCFGVGAAGEARYAERGAREELVYSGKLRVTDASLTLR